MTDRKRITDAWIKAAGRLLMWGAAFWLLLLWVMLSQGCAQYQSVTSELKSRGAEVNDTLLSDSEWFICYGASVGSIQRRYNTAELAQAWHDLCRQQSEYELAPDGS